MKKTRARTKARMPERVPGFYLSRPYGELPIHQTLARWLCSRAVQHRKRVAIGTVLARREEVRPDDLGVLLHLLRADAPVEDIEAAASVALFWAEFDKVAGTTGSKRKPARLDG